jgi:hypothetical protein
MPLASVDFVKNRDHVLAAKDGPSATDLASRVGDLHGIDPFRFAEFVKINDFGEGDSAS